jgi:two-component system LytT family response regulator
MSMIRTIIIDDEEDGSNGLKSALTKYCLDINIEGIFNDPEQGLNAILKLKPDLVFLDVQMPQMSGFDVLQHASPVSFEVIFVSAHDQYAIKAIKFSALDYLLKPVDIDELIHAVKKVKERLMQNANHYEHQSLLTNIRQNAGKIEKLAVPSSEGIDFFNTEDIIYCKADGSYTSIVMIGGRQVLVCKNLKDFEHLLGESGFIRIHHSYIVNSSHVLKYIKGDGGYVILTENHHVDVSRRKKEEFLSLLNKL